MKKTITIETSKDAGTMLIQKTNEDFNKKPPIPKDFKENKQGLIKKSSSTKLKLNKDENR
jgi:hypothetical protein